MKSGVSDKHTLPLIISFLFFFIISFQAATIEADQLPTDDFNDNTLGDLWDLVEDVPTKVWLEETNQHLEARAIAEMSEAEAACISNQWLLSTSQNFSMQIDWHHLNLARDAGLFFAITLPGMIDETFIGLSVERKDDTGEPEFICDGSTNDFEFYDHDIPRTVNDGIFYISYNSSSDLLYLSINGYMRTENPENGDWVFGGLLKGDWNRDSVAVTFGFWNDENAAYNNGDAYFDNFRVLEGTIVYTNGESLIWNQVNTDGFGDAQTGKVIPSIVFKDYLYVGSEYVNAYGETSDAGKIWKSSDGTTWVMVDSNVDVIPYIVFDGYLYGSKSIEHSGGEIWRSSNGTTWQKVVSNGFGNSNNEDTNPDVISNDYLYAGTENETTGGEIWRSSDGSTWNQVDTDGFGDSNNGDIFPRVVLDGYLYAGTWNVITGGEIWRSPDGINWDQVNTDGFGDSDNYDISPEIIFNNYLYASVTNEKTGGQIWRSSNGTTWKNVVSNGFGDSNNEDIEIKIAANSYLYVAAENDNTGAEIWRSLDGTTWNQINPDGFGDSNNDVISGLLVFGDYLYAGTENVDKGGQIWRTIIDPTDRYGDINCDGNINLTDVILSLKIVVGINPAQPICIFADMNNNGKVGIEEAIYGLETIAGLSRCDISGWKKNSYNPFFSSEEPGNWDDSFRGGTVLKDPDEPINKYKMWYVGGKTANDEGMSIGYATSSDGIDWVPYSSNPIITHGNTWDINGFSGVNVIKDGSTYKLWYEGIDINGVNRIGYATSSNGINWVPYPNNPIFSPGGNSSWDDDDVGDPCVIKEGSTYKMWYWGDNDATDIDQIGLAISIDGINWLRTGTDGLVLSPDSNITWENGNGIGSPTVIKNEQGYTLAYHAADQSGTVRIGIATSADGLTWDKKINPILDVGDNTAWDSDGVGPMTLIEDSTYLKLWYLGAYGTENIIKVGSAIACKNFE